MVAFPVNVPNVPGVPAVIFAPDAGGLLSLIEQDALSLFAGSVSLPWGIYLTAVPVVLADNVVSFSYDQKFQISDYPVEDGSFASYNKVYQPFEARLRFTRGGGLVERQAFLDSIAAIIGDLNSYNVVTANAVYLGVNLVDYTYHQTAGAGLGLISVDVTARQVKTVAGPFLSNTISPTSASQVNDGVTLPIPASTVQISDLPPL